MQPNVHTRTIDNSQDMEATWMSINRWTNKENVVYTHTQWNINHKKEWNNVIHSNMDGLRDDCTKWS